MRKQVFFFLFFFSLGFSQEEKWLSFYAASCFSHPSLLQKLQEKVGVRDSRFLCFLGQTAGIHPESIAFASEKDPLFNTLLSKLHKKEQASSLAEFLKVFSEEERWRYTGESLTYPYFSYKKPLEELKKIEVEVLPPFVISLNEAYAYPLRFEESFFLSSFSSFLQPSLLKNFSKLPRNPFPQ